MWRRSFVTFLGSTIVMGSFTAYARQSGRLRRIGVLMSYPEYRSRRTDVPRCVPRGTPETRLDRGPTAFFNSPIGRANCHRRNQVVRHSTQVGRKYRRPRRKHPSKEALVRFRLPAFSEQLFRRLGQGKKGFAASFGAGKAILRNFGDHGIPGVP